MVIRTQKLKIGNIKNLERALRHRMPGSSDEVKEERSRVKRKIIEFETRGNNKLRKNASIFEFVISLDGKYKDDKEYLEKVASYFISTLLDELQSNVDEREIIQFITETMFHFDKDNSHVHILFSAKKWNLDKDKYKKIDIKPYQIVNAVEKTLIEFDYESYKRLLTKDKNIGAYDLGIIREIERRIGIENTKELIKIARELNIDKREFKRLFKEYEDNLFELYETLRDEYVIWKKTRKSKFSR